MGSVAADNWQIRIDSDEALADFRRRLRSPGPLPDKVSLDYTFVAGSRSHHQRLERRMNNSLADCGCDAGAAAVILAATSMAIRRLTSGNTIRTARVGRGAAVLAGAAVLGKLAGLAYHRTALIRLSGSIAPRTAKAGGVRVPAGA